MTDTLPIETVLPELRAALEQHDTVILEAPPGAGKTTRVPLALADAGWLGSRLIRMLEPRRIAARNAAARLADLTGEPVGESIGYRMRLDTRVSRRTRIEVITEGILGRMLLADPSLSDTGLVIFDEFHERSLDADSALALCLQGRELFRDGDAPLKLLIMSATLDTARLAALLDAPVVSCAGRQFPVEPIYGRAAKPRERIADRVTATTRQAIIDNPDSSLLVFLPGQGEIREVARNLAGSGPEIFPLYGDQSLEDQRRAIAPGPRKVVVATNIAETSLTIEGVDVVVDSGLAREPVFDPASGMTRLQTRRISRAASEQRMGRAGRLRPGKCYRLWTREQQHQLAATTDPEILNADLAPLALQLLQWGVTDPNELTWVDPPPTAAWSQALDLLGRLEAIERTDGNLRLTPAGEQMSRLAVHPRLSHLLVQGRRVNELSSAAAIAAILSDRFPFDDPDIQVAMAVLNGERNCPQRQQGWRQRTRTLARQLEKTTGSLNIERMAIRLDPEQVPGFLLASAYPDRIARRRHKGGYQLAGGRSASLPRGQHSQSSWLAVAEVSGAVRSGGDTIRSAANLDEALFTTLLAGQVSERDVVEWQKRENRFIAERRREIGALVLARQKLANVSPEARTAAVIRYISDSGLQALPWTADAQHCRARLQHAHQLWPDWPDVDEASLLETLGNWLGPYLTTVSTPRDLKQLDLSAILMNQLSWEQQQQLDRALPARITVPSGSRIQVDYTQDPPVLKVKLQEMFGQVETPVIGDGRLPLVIELLSPAGRPLQVTQDLAHFWANAYNEVRKEMKGRYPKHPWPDDPLTAVPTARTKGQLR